GTAMRPATRASRWRGRSSARSRWRPAGPTASRTCGRSRAPRWSCWSPRCRRRSAGVPVARRPFMQPRRAFLSRAAAALVGRVAVRGGSAAPASALLVSDPIFLEHRAEGHPERAERLIAIGRALDALPGLRRLAPRAATPAELELVHSAAHVERMRALSAAGGGAVDPDTY